MDTLERDSRIIQDVLLEYARIPYAHGDLECVPAFDPERRRYVLLVVGWQGGQRIHHCLVHVNLVGDRVWIHYDGTEDGIAEELVQAGIPRERIVLGFHPAWKRPITGYAVA
jgi:hypothetical protein